MDDPWPSPSRHVRDLIRRGAEQALHPHPDWVAEIDAAALSSTRMEAVAADPVLAQSIRRTTMANLLHWAAANVQSPGRRVPPNLDPDNLETARDLARRGLDGSALDSYRTGQSTASRRWMTICFQLTQDPDVLHELLDVTLLSIATFIDDTLEAVASIIETERDQLRSGSHAERRATVSLILEGAPLSRVRAETQLGYPLTGPHVATIVWTAPDADTTGLEAAAEALVQASGATRRLTVVATSASHWLWLPISTAPSSARLTSKLLDHPEVNIAVGRPGRDLDGFRRSHLDASTTQRMMSRLASPQRVARYPDIQLVALMTSDRGAADEYVAEVLGDLATAPTEIRDVVLAFVEHRFNTSRTADRLHTHRNTVIRRLARADELLPRPLAANPVDVAAALRVLVWQGDR